SSCAGCDSVHDVAPRARPPAKPERRPCVLDAIARCLHCCHFSPLRYAAARSAASMMNRSGSSAIACPMNVAIPAASQTASRSESSRPSLYPSAAACIASAGRRSTSLACRARNSQSWAWSIRYLIASSFRCESELTPAAKPDGLCRASPSVALCLGLLRRSEPARLPRPTLNARPAPDIGAAKASHWAWEVWAGRENRDSGSRDAQPLGDVRGDDKLRPSIDAHLQRLTWIPWALGGGSWWRRPCRGVQRRRG